MRLWMAVLCCAAATAIAGSLEAGDKEQAQALFKDGVKAMMAGDFEEGCPKIAETYRITEGAGALFTLAECYAKWEKPTTARRHYRSFLKLYSTLSAAGRKRHEERAKLATTQIDVLTPLVPKLTIVIPPDTDVEVVIDDEPVPSDALGSPLPLEVGPHRVVVTASDGRTATKEVDLSEGVERRWEVRLERKDVVSEVSADRVEPSAWTPLEIAGVVIGATGLVGVGVGAVTGGLALGKRSTADDNCVEQICNAEGLDAVEGGKTLGDISTATLAVGGAALVAGLVLFLVGGDSDAEVSFGAEGMRLSF